MARRLTGRSTHHAREVLVVGSGVAGLEACLALRALAGRAVKLTLLTPADEFIYQPIAVFDAYERLVAGRLGVASRLEMLRLRLEDFASELHATVTRGTMTSVDPTEKTVVCTDGAVIPYDSLLIATGAPGHAPVSSAVLLYPAHPDDRLDAVMRQIDHGSVHSVAFVAQGTTWPLPIYELALLARRVATSAQRTLELVVVTSEGRPLEAFGANVSGAVEDILRTAKIDLRTGSTIDVTDGRLIVNPGATELEVDQIVAVPSLSGPRIAGLPCDAHGFLPVGAHSEVIGTEDVFAAGDGTNFHLKFGSVAAQQADAAAEMIASHAGAELEPAPRQDTVHGILVTGFAPRERLYFSARIEEDAVRDSRVSDEPTWSPKAKIAARYLGPYLDQRFITSPG